MDAITLSQSIKILTASLDIKKAANTNFYQWLKSLCKLCSASNGGLKSTHRQQQYTEEWEYRSQEHDTIHTLDITFNLEDYDCQVSLNFPSLEKLSLAKDSLLLLKETINICLTLGITHHKYYQYRQLQYQSLSTLNLGVLELNKYGHVIHTNHFANSLIESSLLTIKHNKRLMLGDQLVTSFFKQHLSYYFNWKIEQNHFFCHLHQQNSNKSNWNISEDSYLLIIQPLRYTPNPQWLMDVFSLTESQAIVASHACLGLSAKEIARITNFSANTVYSYLKAIYAKLNISNQSQLASAIWPALPI